MDGAEYSGRSEGYRNHIHYTAHRLLEHDGRFSRFIAYSTYPKCKYVEKIEEEAKKKTESQHLPRMQKGRHDGTARPFGTFYSCSNYPKCKYMRSRQNQPERFGELCKVTEMAGTRDDTAEM